MQEVQFPVWDAPGIGSPRHDLVSTQWFQDRLTPGSPVRLTTVTLARVDGTGDELPTIAVSSMDVAIADPTRRGLTVNALLPYGDRLAALYDIPGPQAHQSLVHLAGQPGTEAALLINGTPVRARRHQIPESGDWVVTSADPCYAVCVAGNADIAVPELMTADLTLWQDPILNQIADITGH
jgi:hypothetical protein